MHYSRLNLDGHAVNSYLEISEGNYPDTASVLYAISDKFIEIYPEGSTLHPPRFELTPRLKRGSVKVTAIHAHINVSNTRETPWKILGISKDIVKKHSVEVDNIDFTKWLVPSFLYVNIVENSYINGRLSRNLSTVPLDLKRGWSYYEFRNPTYVPIDVKEFSKIVLEIRDMNGNFVCFDSSFKTVVTLHLKPINRDD